MNPPARRLGIVIHRHRPEVIDLAHRAMAWAEDNGTPVELPSTDAELVGRADLAGFDDVGAIDVVLSLGGDGTMLRAVQLAAPHDVAVIGVNAGQLGYLTQVAPDDLEAALDGWCAGTLVEEERMLISASVRSGREHPAALALNEVVLERAESGHSVSVEAAIGNLRFTSYLADGVIVATPTGSTAYSLSAGGPIVEPDFEALVVTPVAPHMVFDRSLVLKPSTPVELTVAGYRNGKVTIDGRVLTELEPGETLVCRDAGRRARLLMLRRRNFHAILKEKFHVEDR